MRIWDIAPNKLCRNHLLGEHRELHAVWVILTKHKKGYSRHPETRRWQGKLRSLYSRHQSLVKEMQQRGYAHKSRLDARLAKGNGRQTQYIDSTRKQVRILRNKRCECKA
ncbi:MAG: pyrimidine dimer DNA glycosylase/endonuclease V [Candidatus Omnitrophota bacterium]|jgi:hypothetical protein